MFQNTSRLECLNGVHFYEQDILYDDHTYSGDIELIINARYLSPGFGVVLLNNEGSALDKQKDLYLFKLGYRSAQVIYKNSYLQKVSKSNATYLYPPLDNTTFIFSKKGNTITFTSSDSVTPLLEYTVSDNWDRFSIGIYSNAGNTINTIDIAAPIPGYWNLNMYNTDGGYVKFFKSGFQFINCMYNAELEQENIFLKAGTYYLKYDVKEAIKSDIKPYVYIYKENSIFNEQKNILIDNYYFTLDYDEYVSVKFAGRNGYISNIHLTENESDKYIGTKDDSVEIDGSSINVNLIGVEYISWTGCILNTPSLSTTKVPFILSNGVQRFTLSDLALLINTEYEFTYYKETKQLIIKRPNDALYSLTVSFDQQSNGIIIFYNLDAYIKDLKIKFTDSEEEDDAINTSNTIKYVTRDVNGPILVLDKENLPLDLSSSYRFIDEETDLGTFRNYIFTNIEREIFESDSEVLLTNQPIKDITKIKCYGVLADSEIHEDMLLANIANGIDDIRLFTDTYKMIPITEDEINFDLGIIKIEDSNLYDYIVVDYMKNNSYCINYIYQKSLYEVEISNNNEDFYLVYDAPKYINGVYEIETHKTLMTNETTTMKPINNCYVVIRKE